MDSQEKFCPYCGASVQADSGFCTKCGAMLTAAEAADNKASANESIVDTVKRKLKSRSFIKVAALALISVLLLVFAFLPLVRYQYTNVVVIDYDDNEIEEYDVNVNIGAFNSVGNFFDALQSQSESKLENSALYDDIADKSEDLRDEMMDLYEDEEYFSKEAAKLTEDIVYDSYRLGLRSSDVSPAISNYIAVVLAIVYILAVIALCGSAVLNLIYELKDIDRIGGLDILRKDVTVPLFTKLICAVPVIICLLYMLIVSGNSVNNVGSSYFDASMAFTAVLSVILALVGIVGGLVLRVLNKEIVIDKTVKTRVIAAAVALVCLFMICAPLYSVSIDEEAMADEKTGHASLDYSFIHRMTKYEGGFYMGGSFGSSIQDAEADGFAYEASSFICAYEMEEGGSALFVIIYLAGLAVAILSSIVCYFSLLQMVEPQENAKRYGALRVWTLVFAIIYLLINLLMVLGLNIMYEENLGEDSMSAGIGIGVVLIFALSIASLVFAPKKIKKDQVQQEAPAPMFEQ